MKYALSARQPLQLLKKADEIIIDYKDFDKMYDFLIDIPNKKFVVRLPYGESIDWEEIKGIAAQCNMVIALPEMQFHEECKKRDIPFFWSFEINTYYELQRLIDLGVSEVLLGGELYFDLPNIKNHFDIPIRLIPNRCFDSFIPAKEGIRGMYVRPEDVEEYEKYVDTFEFFNELDLKKEATLYHIYAENKQWPGNLNILLNNLNVNVDNRGFPDEFGEVRTHCRQKCMRGQVCRFCENAFKFVNTADLNKGFWLDYFNDEKK